ncbi:MAG: 3-isopropylmalate dehydratase small subunit [Thermoplasmata archaeon]
MIDPQELKKHVFEIALPQFAKEARVGDILVADENFGSGSSREHAPQAMRAIGVGAVVADSFARIFFRNAINLGLPTVEARGVRAIFETGDTARIEMRAGRITNMRTGVSVTFPPLPPHLLSLLEAGGLVEKVRAELEERKAAAAAAP